MYRVLGAQFRRTRASNAWFTFLWQSHAQSLRKRAPRAGPSLGCQQAQPEAINGLLLALKLSSLQLSSCCKGGYLVGKTTPHGDCSAPRKPWSYHGFHTQVPRCATGEVRRRIRLTEYFHQDEALGLRKCPVHYLIPFTLSELRCSKSHPTPTESARTSVAEPAALGAAPSTTGAASTRSPPTPQCSQPAPRALQLTGHLGS